ncbi:hypothetical protein Taro_013304 [Colocasia esculenta]|uniref:Uncharacterized protein n=1 Tax=Colocasia esculenta TaxID=4460 RepID=A0A843UFK1_COLES|nr:hypothetical protein [Colocasia esculenta]
MDGGERAVAPAAQPHRFGSGGGVGGSEFFICFTSRPSSTSMRIPSSKSLPSPGRADKYRDPAVAAPSLSASLSRRLKSSGSVKGGQSPATIPAGGGSRRKSCAFEAAEPSSPKVTCIGQVKVKTARMKKKKTLRSASQRAGRGGGEATFRRLEERGGEGEARDGGEDRDCLPNRNQRWVHLPLGSICDALRAFGSEFSCFLPCGGGGRSHCASSTGAEREKGERTGGVAEGNGVAEKRARDGGMGSCGAALARWLMAVQESEGVKRGEMVELVVEEVDGRGMAREVRGMEVPVDAEKGGLVVKEEREGRLGGAAPLAAAACAPATAEDDGETVCVPPPNALLLMRCRSDPVRMAALATRFWGSPAAARVQVEVDEEDHEGEEEEEVADHKKEESYRHDVLKKDGEEPEKDAGQEGRRRWSFSSERRPVLVDTTAEAAAVVMDKKRKKKKKKEGEEEPGAAREDDLVVEVRSFERPIAAAAAPAAAEEARRRGEKRDELPDCLLLMMYEPKLSMEVSRETWVCTSDFLRFRPHHHRHQPQQQPRPAMDAGAAQGEDAGDGGGAAENKAEVTAASDAVSLPHPSQSPPPPPTAPAPAAASPTPAPAPAPPPEAAKTPEKKPASAAASSPLGAPFGLTRCKSEPMRSTAKMEPDACFWKSRHRPIGAAGIGF